ncbi:ATP-binding protein [Natronospora cellulosivora (SeqCode)]
MHILDIVQNSIVADASRIEVIIKEDLSENLFQIEINDNGKGISPEVLENITDPFLTSRTTRPVGMGLPLFKEAAERCDGELIINSQLAEGTELKVVFKHDHIDRAPLGDIKGTLISLIALNPQIDFLYKHIYKKDSLKNNNNNNNYFILDTAELKKELEDVDINQKEVLNWIAEFIKEGLKELYGGDC